MPDPRDYNENEILSFVEKTNQAEHPERLIGMWSGSGVRTVDHWIDFEQMTDIRRIPMIKNVPLFMVQVSQAIDEFSSVGLSDEDRRVIGKALKKVIYDITPIPPEPARYTTVKVTYSDPGPSPAHGWDYYFFDGGDHASPPSAPHWMGPDDRFSWADLQRLGRVEIMPNPGRN